MCSMCKENMLLPFFIDADIRAIKFKMSLGKKNIDETNGNTKSIFLGNVFYRELLYLSLTPTW